MNSFYYKVVNYKYLSIILFLCIMLPFYIYYFLNLFAPGLSPDTIQYLFAAKQINAGALPLDYLPVDIPLGLPLFFAIMFRLAADFLSIIVTQVALFAIVNVFFIHQISKIHKLISLFLAIFVAIWSISPRIMYQITSLYPDGLYVVALVFCVASFVFYIRKKNLFGLIIFFMGIFFVSIIRSNGPYIFFIPIAIVIWSIIYKQWKTFLNFIIGTVVVLIVLSSINIVYKGYFFPGEYHRIKRVTMRVLDKDYTKPEKHSFANPQCPDPIGERQIVEGESSGKMFVDYLFYTKNESASFFYSLLPKRYLAYNYTQDSLINGCPCNHQYLYLNSPENKTLNIAKILAWSKQYDSYGFVPDTYFSITNYDSKYRKLIPLLHHAIYKITYIVFHKFLLIPFLFFMAVFYAMYQFFRHKNEKRFSWLVIMIISGIHLLSAIILSFVHSRIQIRYINVTEFIIYLVIALCLIMIVKKKPIFKL
jgi:hypothetical protein